MKSMNAKFTINLKTAKAMGIELSTSALLRADEVIDEGGAMSANGMARPCSAIYLLSRTEMTLGELSWKSKAKRSLCDRIQQACFVRAHLASASENQACQCQRQN